MKTPVEARSLSALTNLFANPPQYPRNPTHETREPLVLYIVRVPGSKDVFLTPLKPPTKASISVEAIQTSLYYLHVETPEDEAVRESLGLQKQSSEAEHLAIATPIPRKPLPPTPLNDLSLPERDQPLQQRYANNYPSPDGAFPYSQTAWPETADQFAGLNVASDRGAGILARKPLGPRPIHSRLQSVDSGAPPRKPVGISVATREARSKTLTALPGSAPSSTISGEADGMNNVFSFTNHDNSPSLDVTPAEPALMQSVGSSLTIPISHELAGTSEARLRPRTPSVSGITLIRRDPTSGGQWNIGNIFHNITSSPRDSDSITIELSTPGYQRFNKYADARPSLDIDFSDAASVRSFISSNRDSPPPRRTAVPVTTLFTREVRTIASRSPTRAYQRNSTDDVSPDAIERNLSPLHTSGRNQHYTFTSPWHGDCDFSTGMNGRSLKCRHTLPASGPENARVSATVAELRFNLPWPTLKSKDSHNSKSLGNVFRPETKESWKRGMQKIKERGLSRDSSKYGSETNYQPHSVPQFHRNGNSEQGSHSDIEHDDRLNLRLGREKAGGGRKGESAKLGKLIIEDEGLKMCDLVVAGCMAVWWRYYTG